MGLHEVAEIRHRIFGLGGHRSACRRIEPRQLMPRSAQDQEMHRAQDQIGVRLSHPRPRRQRLQLGIRADAGGQPPIERASGALRVLREEPPIVGRLADHLHPPGSRSRRRSVACPRPSAAQIVDQHRLVVAGIAQLLADREQVERFHLAAVDLGDDVALAQPRDVGRPAGDHVERLELRPVPPEPQAPRGRSGPARPSVAPAGSGCADSRRWCGNAWSTPVPMLPAIFGSAKPPDSAATAAPRCPSRSPCRSRRPARAPRCP